MPSELQEVSSLDRWTESDLSAWFERVYEGYYPRIFRYVYRMLGDREQAEDAAQDTFLKAWRSLPRMKTRLRVSPWLFRIATNTARDVLRRRLVIAWVSLQGQEEVTEEEGSPDPQLVCDESEVVLMLQRAFDSLPPPHKAILVEWERQGRSARNVAAATGVAVHSASRRLTQARKAWKQAFETFSTETFSTGARR